MEINNSSQLKLGALLTYITMIAGLLISVFYTPIMVRLLGSSEYGLYNLAASVISYLGVLNFGFGSAYIRYYSRYRESKDFQSISKLNGMFIKIFIFISIISLIAGSLITLFSDNVFGNNLTLSELRTGKILLVILTINITLKFPTTIFSTYIRVNERFVFERLVNLIGTLINPFIILPVLLLGYGSIGMLTVLALSSIVIEIVHIIYAIKKLGFRVRFGEFDAKLFKEIVVFSAFIFISMIVDQINWNVDKFLLGRINGTTAVAIYSIASIFNLHYLNLSTAVSSVFVPRVHKLINEPNARKQLTLLFTKVGRIQFMLLSLFLTGFILFGKPFISWWAGSNYEESYYIAVVLLSAVTIPIIQNLGIEIQQALNMHRFRSILYLLIAIGNIIISIPLIYKYSGFGAAIGTAISLFLGNILIMNIFYHKRVGINILYFWREILVILPGLIIPLLVGYTYTSIFDISKVPYLLIGVIGYSIIFAISIFKISMNVNEKKMIIKPLRIIYSLIIGKKDYK